MLISPLSCCSLIADISTCYLQSSTCVVVFALSCSNLLSLYIKIGEGNLTKPASCATWLIKLAVLLPSEKDTVSMLILLFFVPYSTSKILDRSCGIGQ